MISSLFLKISPKNLQNSSHEGGVLIRQVPWGSSACGVLEPRDILISVDGRSIDAEGFYTDPRLGQLANSLPDSIKMSGFTTKLLLKEIACRYLPRDVVYRRKIGFTIPAARLIRGDLREEIEDLFSEAPTGSRSYVTSSASTIASPSSTSTNSKPSGVQTPNA